MTHEFYYWTNCFYLLYYFLLFLILESLFKKVSSLLFLFVRHLYCLFTFLSSPNPPSTVLSPQQSPHLLNLFSSSPRFIQPSLSIHIFFFLYILLNPCLKIYPMTKPLSMSNLSKFLPDLLSDNYFLILNLPMNLYATLNSQMLQKIFFPHSNLFYQETSFNFSRYFFSRRHA